MKRLRTYVGLTGVDPHERREARKAGRIFEWILFVAALFFPLLWEMGLNHHLYFKELDLIHWALWLILVCELGVVLNLVRNKKTYLVQNWLNLLVIIVAVPIFWNHLNISIINQVIRILIIVRLLVPILAKAREVLTRNHLGATLLVFLLLVIAAGFTMSLFDSSINTPAKGIWWAMETVTTVGYGDEVPHTWPGRIFAMVIMVMGVTLVSILTANISAYLLGKKPYDRELHRLLKEMQGQLEDLKTQMDKLEKKAKRD